MLRMERRSLLRGSVDSEYGQTLKSEAGEETGSINGEEHTHGFYSEHNSGTFFGSTFNIMTCVIGSGVLSLRKLKLLKFLNFIDTILLYSFCL
jgi:hypothetical protein